MHASHRACQSSLRAEAVSTANTPPSPSPRRASVHAAAWRTSGDGSESALRSAADTGPSPSDASAEAWLRELRDNVP